MRPYQPAGYYKHLNFPTRDYHHDKTDSQWRRGVYTHWQRMYLHPMLRAFDAPSREECTAKRARSNTPLAALVLLNDPSFVEAARGLAIDVLANLDADDVRRLNRMFQIVTSRLPDAIENEVLANVLDEARQEYQSTSEQAKSLLAVGTLRVEASQWDAAELAAWTTVARGILNLSEAYTRN